MLILLFLTLFLEPSHASKTSPASTPLVQKASNQRFEVSIQKFETQIKEPLQELKTFTFTPSMANGLFSGIKVSNFRTNCKLPDFGIQENDTIESINGIPLRLPSDIYEIGKQMQKAKPGHKVRVSVYRKNQSITYTYLLVK